MEIQKHYPDESFVSSRSLTAKRSVESVALLGVVVVLLEERLLPLAYLGSLNTVYSLAADLDFGS